MYWENQIRRIRNRQNLFVDWILGCRGKDCQLQNPITTNGLQTVLVESLAVLRDLPQPVENPFPQPFSACHFASNIEKTEVLAEPADVLAKSRYEQSKDRSIDRKILLAFEV